MTRFLVAAFCLMFSAPGLASSQTYAPLVTMRVTLPDGTTQDVSARESTVATVTLKDGTVYELRPTVHDEPFTTVTVSIFKAATTTEPSSVVAEVRAVKGGAAVESKSKPNFKVAVANIAPAVAKSSS